MDEMNAFERQIAGEVIRAAAPARQVDAAAVFAAIPAATKSPKRTIQNMFSATKFVVAGAIVALFGGFLLTGVLTLQSDERQPVVGASASATTQADSSDAMTSEPEPTAEVTVVDTTGPDLLPGVDLTVEAVEPGVFPGVFLVTGDGYRDIRGRDMTVSAEGDVWLLRGGVGDWSVVRLGESGTSLHLKDGQNRRASLRTDRAGAPVVESWRIGGGGRAQVFDGTAWITADRSDPACPQNVARESVTIMPDGTCWGPGRNRFEDGRWQLVPDSELGLAEDEGVGANTVGPDGTGWVTVFHSRSALDEAFDEEFDGLLRYDGATWTRVRYTPSERPGGQRAFTSDLAVAPDGTVWVVELSNANPGTVMVRSWDGTTWSSYGPITRPPYPTSVGSQEPRGTHFNDDGTIWFMDGWLYFDGTTLHPFDLDAVRPLKYEAPTSRSPKGFDPRGNVWVLAPDRQLLVITPEAVATGR